jgi:hypothetical protein
MDIIRQTLLANALAAILLAIAAAAISRFARRPPLAHFLWLLVLLKLVTPPVWSFEIPIAVATPAADTPGELRVASAPPQSRGYG